MKSETIRNATKWSYLAKWSCVYICLILKRCLARRLKKYAFLSIHVFFFQRTI